MKYQRWSLSKDDLKGLNPVKARDLIIKCFFEAQKETFASVKRELGVTPTDESIMDSVTSAVRVAFKKAKGSFDNPTKEDLSKVVQILARKASSWGTPPDIIEHHKNQIMTVLKILE